MGEQIRSLLLDPNADIDGRAELLLFSAARAQLVSQVIKPALSRGAVVIADRFYDSSTAYQGGGRGLADAQWLQHLHQFATAGRSPDRTYLIDVPLGVASARRSDKAADRMELGDAPFYQRVRDAYLVVAHTDRVLLLDGEQDAKAVRQQVEADALAMLTCGV